jgi:predicted NUDIX family NTP pyrophosphohydrolase
MAGKQSAGLLLHRRGVDGPEVLLVHPGGPLWAKRDEGAWSLPKGEFEPGDDPLQAALREFQEELGSPPPAVTWQPLGSVLQRGGKTVHAWSGEGDLDVATVQSSTFFLEWPPRSGRRQEFPEVDRAAWFPLDEARRRLLEAQRPFLDRLDLS